MIYFGGGYPGLYFPTAMEVVYAPPASVQVELPMVIMIGETTQPVPILVQAKRAMAIVAAVEVPMTRGVATRTEILMRVLRETEVAPSVVGAQLPMRVALETAIAPMCLMRATTIAMPVTTSLELPMRRGLAEVPMRVTRSTTRESHVNG